MAPAICLILKYPKIKSKSTFLVSFEVCLIGLKQCFQHFQPRMAQGWAKLAQLPLNLWNSKNKGQRKWNDCRNQINIQKDQHKITNKLFEVQTKTEFSTAENHLNRMKSNTNLLVKNIKLNSSTEVYLLLNKEKYFRLNRSRK